MIPNGAPDGVGLIYGHLGEALTLCFFLRREGWEGGGKVVAAFGGFMISTGGTYKLPLLNMN